MSKNWQKFILWLIMWLFVVGVGYMMSAEKPQKQTESLNELLISHNALMPVSPVEFPHTIVLANKITFCESQDDHFVCEKGGYCDGGKAYGKWQFHEKTFYWLAGLAGYKNVNWKNEDDQDLVGMWALKNGYAYLWSCLKLIK